MRGRPRSVAFIGKDDMIDCYTWTTDNGYKPRMMLEETGLLHKIIPVNIREKMLWGGGENHCIHRR